MSITLFNLNWGYQVVWLKPGSVTTVLEAVEDALPGPHRSIPCEVKAQAALTQWRNENLFDTTIKPYENAILTQAIQGTRPGWQFWRSRESGHNLLAWKDIWGGVAVNGKAPEPLKARSAQKLAQRIRLYEDGRSLVKGKVSDAPS